MAVPGAMRRLCLLVIVATLAGACTVGSAADASMSLAIQNGSTLTVSLVVNDQVVATLLPNDCRGCQTGSEIPASQLPDLPWNVEARSPSGRVLVSMTVKSGDVVQTSNSWKGDANRVDLSCGRIDIWSGPPLLGPAPGPGTPGDCAP